MADTKKALIDAENAGKTSDANFYKDVADAQKGLQAGTLDWGQAWSTLMGKYGPQDKTGSLGGILDTMLNKDVWSKPGAYQDKLNTETKAKAGTLGQ